MESVRIQTSQSTDRLFCALHEAQAEGIWEHPHAVRQLLEGIASAVVRTAEQMAGDPARAWALKSPVYWEHFEMHLKEALLGASSGLPPALRQSIREALERSLATVRTRYLDG